MTMKPRVLWPVDLVVIQRALAVLKSVEWIPADDMPVHFCPWCDASQRDGHNDDCELQSAIADLECEL